MTEPTIHPPRASHDSAQRTIFGRVSDMPPMAINTGAGGMFAADGYHITYQRNTLAEGAPWTITAIVHGNRIRADGTVGVRHGGASYIIRPGQGDSPAIATWPTWLAELIRDNHPNTP